ncbi:peptidoglycan-binding domain-containing protein, partial [Streptomyces sp. IBSBF 2806]|uniref:peptidoglycan-binding domain-containing protein n=1 Tax=Streptomyces sp. IBSBF 2806 TaxID=2903529 RepID=UPI002FDBB4BE
LPLRRRVRLRPGLGDSRTLCRAVPDAVRRRDRQRARRTRSDTVRAPGPPPGRHRPRGRRTPDPPGPAGYYDGQADGAYSRQVEAAVRTYQLTRAIVKDESGVYGAATRASLEAETAEH